MKDGAKMHRYISSLEMENMELEMWVPYKKESTFKL